MNAFQDLEHALVTGVVLASLRAKGIEAELLLNNVEDTTPYIKLNLDRTEVVVVVLPRE